MNNETQIIKGILEGCILKLIQQEEIYGYRTVERLNQLGFDVNEATVYPILTRLQNKGQLYAEKRASPYGPVRKYYFLTKKGEKDLILFIDTWKKISKMVNNVLEVVRDE